MLNRRGFLGSLIGTLIVPQLDFFARLDIDEWQRVVLPYRMLFRCNGVTIQAPGVASVECDGQVARFVAEPLMVKTMMVADRVILLTERGRVISDRAFDSGPISLINGDKLCVTTTLSIDGAQHRLSIDFFLKKG